MLHCQRLPGEPARVHLDHLGRVPDLVRALVSDGVRLTRVEPLTPTLEDLYFAVRRGETVPTPNVEGDAESAEALR